MEDVPDDRAGIGYALRGAVMGRAARGIRGTVPPGVHARRAASPGRTGSPGPMDAERSEAQ